MKCGHVQSVIVEYAEGALCVADELCVDIHLVQCESCRAEVRGVAAIGAVYLAALNVDDCMPDTLGLLDRLDAATEVTRRRERVAIRPLAGPILRAGFVAIVVCLALTTGAAKWPAGGLHEFGVPPVEAAGSQSLVETIRPLSSPAELNQLRDLDELTGSPVPSAPDLR